MEKIKEDIKAFKNRCEDYLFNVGLNDLRVYGRLIGMRAATKLKKADLIKEIIGVLCGEIAPSPTKRGAPVKNAHIDPKLVEEIERLGGQYLYIDKVEEIKEEGRAVEEKESSDRRKNTMLTIKDSNGKIISFCGSILNFQIRLGGSIELMKGETYTISVEEADK